MSREYVLEKPGLRSSMIVLGLSAAGFFFQRMSYRAFAAAAKVLGFCAASQSYCRVALLPDSWFRFDLSDFYWNRLVSSSYKYEPEIAHLLYSFRDSGYVFLDCGANYGYWSILASSERFGAGKVIAVEACENTFLRLKENVDLNNREVVSLRRAISAVSHQRVEIYTRGSHAGASISSDWLSDSQPLSSVDEVETISIDDIVRNYVEDLEKPIVIKLDVEGVEIEALQGATETLSCNPLIIYEEHGADRECATSRFVMSQLGLTVFFIDDDRNTFLVTSLEQVNGVKKHRSRGYNFVAVVPNSDLFNRMERLARDG